MSSVAAIPGFFEPFGSMLHLLAAGVAAVVGTGLARAGRDRSERVALAIFAAAAVVLLSLSGTYHTLEASTPARLVLQRLDHAAIWLLIAATFTGLHGLAFRGPWRWAFLGAVWTAAITALVIEAVFFEALPAWVALSFYLALGWLGLVSGVMLWRRRVAAVRPLVAGGLAYSVGAVYDFAEAPALLNGVIAAHEVFHVAVVAGLAFHFVALWRLTALPAFAPPARGRARARRAQVPARVVPVAG
jgi:channel protein (hemolysin III family)